MQQPRRINPQIASSYCLLKSYAKQAYAPISFVHYTHEHPVSSKISYARSSDMCTIFIFMEGKFGFLVDDVIYNPSYGSAMIFRNYEEFTSVFYTNSHVDYYQIELPAQFLETISVPAMFDPKQGASCGHMLIPDRDSSNQMIEKLQQIEAWILTKNTQLDLLAYANVLQIIGILATQDTKQKGLPVTKVPTKLRVAVEYIHRNYATLSGIEEVAAACGITSTYLSRMFRTSFSCTPNAYLNQLRISHAKYLLSTGSTLTEACYGSGFSNYTYFISKFKSITGITPAKFKEETINRGK